jgi:3-oxoadipate enol-lactonase/4-carboxymuconolactone decarboxylase
MNMVEGASSPADDESRSNTGYGASPADDGPTGDGRTDAQRHAQGMTIRREVLGNEHVDRAVQSTDAVTADFQDFISRYAWGDVWARPGLDRRSRSIAVLTALVAHGHYDELAMHIRAAVGNGLTPAEIGEVLLQAGVYLGVPAANSAFKVAQRVLAEMPASARDDQGVDHERSEPSPTSDSTQESER